MKNRQLRVVVLVGILFAASGPAVAAGSGFYFGLNAGRSDFDANAGDIAGPPPVLALTNPVAGFAPGPISIFMPILQITPVAFIAPSMLSSDFDQRDTTWSASVGYTVNRYLSVELSYADLGELRASQTATFPIAGVPQFRMTQKLSVQTLAVSALATLPLSQRWSLFARGGYAFSESEMTVGFGAPTAAQVSRRRMDFNSDDFTVGAGIGFEFSTHWWLRADYERILDAGTSAAGSGVDVDTVGLSAIYRL